MSERGEASISGCVSETPAPRDSSKLASPMAPPLTVDNVSGRVANTSVGAASGGARIVARRRRRAPAAVFYVHAGGSQTSGDSSQKAAQKAAANGGPCSGAVALAERSDGEDSCAQRAAFQAAAKIAQSLCGVLPEIVHPTVRSKWNMNALVFGFFLTVFIFLVHVAHRHMVWMTGFVSYDSEQNLAVAASVTEQLHAKADEVRSLMRPVRKTPPEHIDRAAAEERELTQLREKVLQVLQTRMGYAGPAEDIRFLLDEHAAYEANLARLAREELQWLEAQRAAYLQSTRRFGAARGRDAAKKKKRNVKTAENALQAAKETSTIDGKIDEESFKLWSHNKIFAAILVTLLAALYVRLQ